MNEHLGDRLSLVLLNLQFNDRANTRKRIAKHTALFIVILPTWLIAEILFLLSSANNLPSIWMQSRMHTLSFLFIQRHSTHHQQQQQCRTELVAMIFILCCQCCCCCSYWLPQWKPQDDELWTNCLRTSLSICIDPNIRFHLMANYSITITTDSTHKHIGAWAGASFTWSRFFNYINGIALVSNSIKSH